MKGLDKSLDYSQLISVTSLSLSFSICKMGLLIVPLGILVRFKERVKCATGFAQGLACRRYMVNMTDYYS